MRARRGFSAALMASVLLTVFVAAPDADAKPHDWCNQHGRLHKHHGRHHHYDNRRHSRVDYQTGKVLKGGLVGAGIGAGTSLLLDRNAGQGALLGAGLGAGAQAVRYNRTLRRHPVAKTAAYGALTGIGVNALRRDSLGKGALWGGGIGAGIGALGHMD